MYKTFKTDETLETSGIEIDYGDFVVTLARAGGANRRYGKALEAKTKPYRRAIQTETMNSKVADTILREVFASTIVLNWQTRVDGELKTGIEGPDGDLLPFNVANVTATLKNLPDLYSDLQAQANKSALFRASLLEGDAGN